MTQQNPTIKLDFDTEDAHKKLEALNAHANEVSSTFAALAEQISRVPSAPEVIDWADPDTQRKLLRDQDARIAAIKAPLPAELLDVRVSSAYLVAYRATPSLPLKEVYVEAADRDAAKKKVHTWLSVSFKLEDIQVHRVHHVGTMLT